MAARSFKLNGPKRQGNMTIEHFIDMAEHGEMISVRLHGNRIALVDTTHRRILLSDCGWGTNTTKTAINRVLTELGINGSIYQSQFQWYFNLNGSSFDWTDYNNKAFSY